MFRILSRNTVHTYTHPHNKLAPYTVTWGKEKWQLILESVPHKRKRPTHFNKKILRIH